VKKEDNYLDRLFEQAKTKPPQLSFEEVANRFETSVASTGSFTVLKNWIGNHLTLHSFIMLTTISSILTVIYLIFAPSNLTDSIPETTQRLTQVESTDIPSTTVIAKEKTESQSKAITLQNSWKESIQPVIILPLHLT